jgi:hypothetical protein
LLTRHDYTDDVRVNAYAAWVSRLRRGKPVPALPRDDTHPLARLPKSGDVWPEAERKLWLQLLEGSFKLIYKDAEAEPTRHRERIVDRITKDEGAN